MLLDWTEGEIKDQGCAYGVVASVPPTSGRTITSIALAPDGRLVAVGATINIGGKMHGRKT